MLPAGLPGKTDNIRVRSIIGRFLEHSRVFFFEAGEDQDIYLSSADWMSRNMTRRIELAWPVLDLDLRQRIVDECLLAYLHDTRNAWTLGVDGKYARVDKKGQKKQSAQALLMQKYSPSNVKAQ
jgi:polyphosphate kinase